MDYVIKKLFFPKTLSILDRKKMDDYIITYKNNGEYFVPAAYFPFLHVNPFLLDFFFSHLDLTFSYL